MIGKHAMRSVLTPIVTIFGLDLGGLLGGAILTETVFSLPGLGQLAIDAINAATTCRSSWASRCSPRSSSSSPTSSSTCSTRVIDPRVRLS